MKLNQPVKFDLRVEVIIVYFLIPLLLRISISIFTYLNNGMLNFEDDLVYWEIAHRMLNEGLLFLDTDKFLYPASNIVGPGISWMNTIALFIYDSWLSIFLLNSIISSSFCLYIYFSAGKTFGVKIGRISSLICVFYPLFIYYVPTSGKEVYLPFLFSIIILETIALYDHGNSLRKIFLIGFSTFLLIHIDERYLAYLPLFSFSIFYFGLSKTNLGNNISHVFLFCSIIILLSIPWIWRNTQVHNRFVLISPRTLSFTTILSNEPYIEPQLEFPLGYISPEQIDSINNGYYVINSMGNIISADQYNSIREGKIPHKFNRVEEYLSVFMVLWKPIDLLNTYTSGGFRFDGKWSLIHNLAIGLTYGILLVFMLPGIYFLYKKRKRIAILFFTIIIYHSIIHVLLIPYTRNRYRIPIDIIIIICSVYGIFSLYNKVKQRSAKCDSELPESN